MSKNDTNSIISTLNMGKNINIKYVYNYRPTNMLHCGDLNVKTPS